MAVIRVPTLWLRLQYGLLYSASNYNMDPYANFAHFANRSSGQLLCTSMVLPVPSAGLYIPILGSVYVPNTLFSNQHGIKSSNFFIRTKQGTNKSFKLLRWLKENTNSWTLWARGQLPARFVRAARLTPMAVCGMMNRSCVVSEAVPRKKS